MKYVKLFENAIFSKKIKDINDKYRNKFIFPYVNGYENKVDLNFIVLIDNINTNEHYIDRVIPSGSSFVYNKMNKIRKNSCGHYSKPYTLKQLLKIKPYTIDEFYKEKNEMCNTLFHFIYDEYRKNKKIGSDYVVEWYNNSIIRFYNELIKIDEFNGIVKANNYNI
jgi:hypothetical protein